MLFSVTLGVNNGEKGVIKTRLGRGRGWAVMNNSKGFSGLPMGLYIPTLTGH